MASLHERVGQMNTLALRIVRNQLPMSEKESDIVYSIADGLAEDYVMRTIAGRCSLKQRMSTPLTKLDRYVDDRLALLNTIAIRLTNNT